MLHLLIHGPSKFYPALFATFGKEKGHAELKLMGPFGPTAFIIRDESMVDHVLQNPDIYARNPMENYPPFGAHSVLGGGSGGVWLGYRAIFEEYFVDGYREDLDEIGEIVRERVSHWISTGEINLLEEIYRIIVEIRARIFFQVSFGCFDVKSEHDYAAIVDRVLSLPVLLFGDSGNGDVDRLQNRCFKASLESSKPNSVGGILKKCYEEGSLNEIEVKENATLYVLAQAPTMGIFWTLYRSVYNCSQTTLRGNRKEMVKAIKEELRLHPPVTSMLVRTTNKDDKIGQLHIPKGSSIIICPMFIQTNPDSWTAPQTFDSNRWSAPKGDGGDIVEPTTNSEDSGGRPSPLPEGQHPSRYLPFGGGSQACQGRWFATDEMLLVIQNVLEMVEMEIIEDGDLLGQALPEQVMLHVYNRPIRDIRLKVKPLPEND